ncbi:MAG: hypothetical protein FK732_08750, partial [Asgard group archaeon]|nr:hypothetical protein [Asgard group archaeon]
MSDREALKVLLDQMGYKEKFSYIFKNHVRLNGEQIERLKLKLPKIDFIPDGIQQLKNLKQLDLEETQIIIFPEAICELQKLEELNLFKNTLNELPSCIGNLQQLKILNLGS